MRKKTTRLRRYPRNPVLHVLYTFFALSFCTLPADNALYTMTQPHFNKTHKSNEKQIIINHSVLAWTLQIYTNFFIRPNILRTFFEKYLFYHHFNAVKHNLERCRMLFNINLLHLLPLILTNQTKLRI
jgi:NADH:ubiquinone oxidoreductase subunit 5 (subunit L)/multisubunit Na+/H+ antiporter MnhA subunit